MAVPDLLHGYSDHLLTPAAEPVVLARDVSKQFGAFHAVRGVTFEIRAGETVALLGPNGAGKSTISKMLSTVLSRTGGALEIHGKDPDVRGAEIRRSIGVLPQESTLDVELTPFQNLYFFARFFGLDKSAARGRAASLLRFVGLEGRHECSIRQLSGGLQQRLALARALVNTPSLMLLDEPTTGLDPHARQLLWEMMSSLKAAGVTQVLTTHYMEEAQQIADRVIIIDGGKIVAHGTPASLIRSHCKAERIVMYFSSSDAARTAQLCLQAGDVEGNSLVIACERSQPALATIDALAQPPDRVVVRPSNLEDVFFAMTGRDLQQCET